jgi:hypothetical protein
MTNETGLSIAKQNGNADIKIYPNPATDVLYITSPLATMQQVTVRDFLGRNVAQFEMTKELAIDISQYAAGIYIISMSNGAQTTSTRFVKQ